MIPTEKTEAESSGLAGTVARQPGKDETATGSPGMANIAASQDKPGEGERGADGGENQGALRPRGEGRGWQRGGQRSHNGT